MKKVGATTRYVAFNITISWITFHTIDDNTTSFTVTDSGTNILLIVDVPRNCSNVTRSESVVSSWTYTETPALHVYLITNSLGAWVFNHALLVIPPVVPPDYTEITEPITTITFYFRSDTQTNNGVTGFKLTQALTITSYNGTKYGSGTTGLTVIWGWRAWLIDKNNATDELTAGTPTWQMTRTVDGEGWQNALAYVSRKTVSIGSVGWVALQMKLYCNIGDGGWVAVADFVSSDLMYRKVVNTTWSLWLYTSKTTMYNYIDEDYTTYGVATWGSKTYNSRIINVQFENARASEVMMYDLQNRDLAGFLMRPYLLTMGPLFYGVIGLCLFYPIYRRTQSVVPILIGFILLGGVGGTFLNNMIPSAGFNFGWLIAVFALTGLFARAIWSLKSSGQ
jgi:hypothetical protein